MNSYNGRPISQERAAKSIGPCGWQVFLHCLTIVNPPLTGGVGGTLAGNALSLAAMRATLTQVFNSSKL
jgi:hypothetical protein